MANINLLPSDLGPKASVLRLAVLLKRIIAAGLTIFCVFSALTIAYVVFLDLQVKKVNTESEVLKKSIKALEETEQKLFLVKDRLTLIKGLTGEQAWEGDLATFERILGGASQGVILTQVSAVPNKIEVSGNSLSSRALADFWAEILVNPGYKTVNLTSFSFNPSAGYSFELGVSNK